MRWELKWNQNQKLIVLLVATMLLCNGCWDKKELNQLALVQMAAVDYNDDSYQVTLQLILPSADQDMVTGNNLWTMRGDGSSVGEALQQIAQAAPRELYLDHLTVVLLGEGLLRQNIEQGIEFLLKENVLRRRTSLLAVQGNAGDLLTESAKLAKMDIYYIENLIKDQKRRVHGGNAIINEHYLSTYNGLQETFMIPRIVLEESHLRLDGAALVQTGTLITWEDRAWLQGYYWTTGGKDVITLPYSDLMPNSESAELENKANRQIVIELQKKACKWEVVSEKPLEIKVHLRGSIKLVSGYDSWKNSIEANEVSMQIQRLVEQKALEELNSTVQKAQQNKTDAFHLGRWLYAWHPQLVEAENWSEQFAKVSILYDVKTSIEV